MVGKGYGLVVDYWGIAADLRTALEMFNPEDIAGILKPINDEQLLAERHREAMRFFADINHDDLYACIALLEPEDVRAQFDVAFLNFSQAMDMVMPDPAANPYRGDLAWLGKVRIAARNTYRDESFELSALGEKVRRLIDDHIRASNMEHLLQAPISVLDAKFIHYVESISDQRGQAQEIEHGIVNEVYVQRDKNPVAYDSLRHRLEALIEAHRQQRISDLELLMGELKIRDEMLDMQVGDVRLGLEVFEKPFYDQLKAALPSGASTDDLVTLSRDVFTKLSKLAVIDWTTREDIKREMRRQMKNILRKTSLSPNDLNVTVIALIKLAESWITL